MKNKALKQTKAILENQSGSNAKTKNILLLCEDCLQPNHLKASLEEHGYRLFLISKNAKGLHASLGLFAIDVVLIPIDHKTASKSLKIGDFLYRLGTVPFIYISTSVDDALMYRAQETYPYGYHVDPIDTLNLHTSIECACHCFKKNKLYEASVQQLEREYAHLKKQVFNVPSNKSKIKICDCFTFQIKDYTLLYQNQVVKLTKHERKLIALMVAQLGSIVDFDQIKEYVWGKPSRNEWRGEIATHNDVRTLIWRFNKKFPAPLIKNAPGIGYLIEP